MYKTKLIRLLQTLDTRERTRFRQFVDSPFFNKHPKIKSLCSHVLSFAPNYDHPQLDRAKVFALLFPKEAYQEGRLNNLISGLLHLLYDFMAQQQFGKEKALQKELLLRELFARDAYFFVERVGKRFRQLQDQATEKSYDYHLREYALQEQLDRLELSLNRRKFNMHLQTQNDHLDLFYFINKLRLACDMSSRNTVIKATYQCHFMEEIRAYLDGRPEIMAMPVVQVYCKTLQMLNAREEETNYQELKSMLHAHGHAFSTEELRTLYNYVLNYCIQKINSGESHYYREILDNYQTMLEKEIIFVNGYLTEWSYKNIITTGIRLREFDWTEQFIHEYRPRLLLSQQENAFRYNLAAFYYARSEYQQALLQLQDVEFIDPSYFLGAKIIQLKSFFELDETEAFLALVEAFKKYLHRNSQISDYRKKANGNFLKLAKSVYQFKTEKSRLRRYQAEQKEKMIRSRLESWDPIANKDWLLEKSKAVIVSHK